MTPAELKSRRAALGLTQAQLAAALGVHRVMLARWEVGMRRPPALLGLALAQVETQPPAAPRPAERSEE